MARSKAKTLIFTATYNEKGNIENLVNAIKQSSPKSDLLVVDDDSPDGTGKILSQIAKKNKNLKVVHRQGKQGLGSAHRYAMNYAIKNKYDSLITMDADFSHDPADIPRFFEALQNFDFVIGSRFMKGGSTDYTGYRRFISTAGNILAKFLLLSPISEHTTSFRAFRVSMLETLEIDQVMAEGYSFFMEFVFQIFHKKFRCTEIPIHFRDRESGESKIPKMQLVYSLATLVRLFLRKVFK